MTLHAYLGRAGTGKSTKMWTEIKQKNESRSSLEIQSF